MRVLILAAGKGTRFGEITQKTPKTLIKVAGKPIIEYTLESLPPQTKEIILAIGHLGSQIKNYVGHNYKGIPVRYARVQELTGTATSVFKVKRFLKNGKFLVLYADDIYSKKELTKLAKFSWAFGLAKVLPPSPKYLNFVLDSKSYIIQALHPTEKQMKTGILVSTGAYIMDSRIFKYKPVQLSNGEYGLPQTILKAAKDIPLKGVLIKRWFQINSPEDIKKAEKQLQ